MFDFFPFSLSMDLTTYLLHLTWIFFFFIQSKLFFNFSVLSGDSEEEDTVMLTDLTPKEKWVNFSQRSTFLNVCDVARQKVEVICVMNEQNEIYYVLCFNVIIIEKKMHDK